MPDKLVTVAEDSARGGLFLFSGTAISTFVLAISSILIARIIGPELYGQYSLAFVAPELFLIFTDLGINQGIIKFTAEHLTKNDDKTTITKIIAHGLYIRALVGVIVFLITYILAEQLASGIFQRPELTLYLRIASISILFQTLFTTANSAFVGIDKTQYNALTTNIQAIAKTIISLLLVLSGLAVTGAIIGHLASYIVGAITGLTLLSLTLRRKQNKTTNSSFAQNAKILIHYGTPLYMVALLAGLIPFIQNIVLAFFTTDSAIGNYKAAVNFSALLTTLSIPITTVLLSAFSKLSSTGTKAEDFFKISNKYTAIIIMPATILIIIFSNQIVQIIYGSTYTSAPSFLATYSLLYFLVGIGSLTLGSLFNGVGDTKITLKMVLITFITLVPLSPLMTNIFGVPGLIIAYLIANTTGTAYGSYIARKKLHVEFAATALLRIYAVSGTAALLPLLLSIYLPLNNLLTVLIGSITYLFIYVTLIPLAKIIDPAEMQQVAGVLNKIRPIAPVIALVLKYQEMLRKKLNLG